MIEYSVDEFVGIATDDTLETQVDKKVSLLYDLCVLLGNHKNRDDREDAVKQWLASYQSEVQMDNAIHDIVVGNSTLNQTLKRKGFLN